MSSANRKYIKLSLYIKVFLIIVLFAMQIPMIHMEYGQYVKFVFLIGILYCLYDLFCNNGFVLLKDKINGLLCAFAFLYAVSILINHSDCLYQNISQLLYMMVIFYLMAMICDGLDSKNIENEMKIVSLCIMVITFVLTFLSMLTFCLNISEWYMLSDSNVQNYLGNQYGKLYGLYNSNACGGIAQTSIFISILIVFSTYKNKAICVVSKLFAIVNIILQYVALVLSQSRGSFFAFLIISTLMAFVVAINETNFKLPKRCLFALVLSVLAFFVIVETSVFIQNYSCKIVFVSDEDAKNIDLDTSYENIIEDFLLKHYENTSALNGSISLSISDKLLGGIGREKESVLSTTGRTEFWKAGFEVFLDHPLFGSTREGLVSEVEELLGEKSSAVENGGLHNLYLTVLVSSGIVGFIVFMGIVLLLIKRTLCALLKNKVNVQFLISFAVVASFLLSELVENRILYQATAFNATFWLYFGYLNYFASNVYKQNSKKEIVEL